MFMPLPLFFCLASACSATRVGAVGPQVPPPTPSEHLGRELGADFTLADWEEVAGYYRSLAAASPNVLLEQRGTSTEGREWLLATISAPENLARLDALKADAARIADSRGLDEVAKAELLGRAKPFLFISVAMHSNECAGPQFGMAFSHLLATSDAEPWKSARENCVVFITPCLNPDGVDHVTHWYRENVGTPYEGTDLLELYQLYAGHDNNRDWFGLALEETRIVTEMLYSEIHPQVYWDVHQQGSTRERFFVPPYRDPLNPNLDAGVITAIDALGSRALYDMTAEGLTGISTGVTYDMWWNGGNRNVPVRHNIVGLLTEAASANFGSPVWRPANDLSSPRGIAGYQASNRLPEPWPGGWWRIGDIIDYELAFGRSLLGSLSREPEVWMRNVMEAAERTTEAGEAAAPRGYLLPLDQPNLGALERLLEGLALGGVEIFRAAGELQADGRAWAPGSIVIPLAQPYGVHVRDLFEAQVYPEGDPPYDVAGWTLPFLFGVERVELHGEFEGQLEAFEGLEDQAANSDARNRNAWQAAVDTLQAGGEMWSRSMPDGGFALTGLPMESGEGEGVEVVGLDDDGGQQPAQSLRLPRIGLLAPWSGVMNEGWLRWFLDSYGLEYTRVRPETLRAGRLEDLFDVIVLPSVSTRTLDAGRGDLRTPADFAGGVGDEGALALHAFVASGGKLIAIEGSTEFAIELFELPVTEVSRDAEDFSCPGSVLRVVAGQDGGVLGVPATGSVMFSRSRAFEVEAAEDDDESGVAVQELLRYAPTRLLRSGWIRGPEAIQGKSAWLRASVGAGEVHLFGFQPAYRGWTEEAFLLFLRALLIGAGE